MALVYAEVPRYLYKVSPFVCQASGVDADRGNCKEQEPCAAAIQRATAATTYTPALLWLPEATAHLDDVPLRVENIMTDETLVGERLARHHPSRRFHLIQRTTE